MQLPLDWGLFFVFFSDYWKCIRVLLAEDGKPRRRFTEKTKASLEIENVSVANFPRASMTPRWSQTTHSCPRIESLEFHLNRSFSPGSWPFSAILIPDISLDSAKWSYFNLSAVLRLNYFQPSFLIIVPLEFWTPYNL